MFVVASAVGIRTMRAYCSVMVATQVTTCIVSVHHCTRSPVEIGSVSPVNHLSAAQQQPIDNGEINAWRPRRRQRVGLRKAALANQTRAHRHRKARRRRWRRLLRSPAHPEVDCAIALPPDNLSPGHPLGRRNLHKLSVNCVSKLCSFSSKRITP